MNFIIYKILFIFIISIYLKPIYVNGNMNQFCKLENRTIVLNICKKPPHLILPVCVGFCASSTEWNFRSNKFTSRTKSCKVTQHRTEYFVCPDSTHTAVELIIPLACSCTKYHCNRHHR